MVASDGNGDALSVGYGVGRGAAYGCYAALEALGFAFLHPLSPTLPTTLQWSGTQVIIKTIRRSLGSYVRSFIRQFSCRSSCKIISFLIV